MNPLDAAAATLRAPQIAWTFSRLGYWKQARRFSAPQPEAMVGKTCLVTGANSGIGFAIAESLAAMGAKVQLLCRNQARGQQALDRLREGSGAQQVALEQVDMADHQSIRDLAHRLAPGPIDVLVHNAGALFRQRSSSPEGIDQTAALHVVGPQLLTQLLRPRLIAAPNPRLIYVSSGGMYAERLNTERLFHPPDPYDGVRAYAQAKRAQVVLAQLWAQHEPKLRCYAMHPGWADTPGVADSLPGFYAVTQRLLRTPSQGADTAAWLASTPEPPEQNGAFVFDRKPISPHWLPSTRKESAADRDALWTQVNQAAGL